MKPRKFLFHFLLALPLVILGLLTSTPRGVQAGFTDTPTAVPSDTPVPGVTPTPGGAPTATPTPGTGGGGGGGGGPSSSISVSKSVSPAQAQIGQLLEYTLSLQNTGAAAQAGVVLSDPLPRELTFLSASSSQGVHAFDAATNTVTFDLGTVAAGSTVSMAIRVRLNSNAQAPNVTINTAVVAVGGAQVTVSNAATLQIVPGALPETGLRPSIWPTLALATLLALVPVAIWLMMRRKA